MKIPTITGFIDRRILINYSVDQEVAERILPKEFKPKLINGRAIVGICLIRLKDIRPKGLPAFVGISSENAAHRIAVEWQDNGAKKDGVYISRRDTSSRLNHLAGGRIFPGVHHLSNFTITETNGFYSIEFKNEDGTSLAIKAEQTDHWNNNNIFKTFESASDFFKQGAVGYSPDKIGEVFDGLELKTFQWKMFPLKVNDVHSSFFEDEGVFPKGSIRFENALLMKNIEHEWKSLSEIEIK